MRSPAVYIWGFTFQASCIKGQWGMAVPPTNSGAGLLIYVRSLRLFGLLGMKVTRAGDAGLVIIQVPPRIARGYTPSNFKHHASKGVI
jgi:hypothetical protein